MEVIGRFGHSNASRYNRQWFVRALLSTGSGWSPAPPVGWICSNVTIRIHWRRGRDGTWVEQKGHEKGFACFGKTFVVQGAVSAIYSIGIFSAVMKAGERQAYRWSLTMQKREMAKVWQRLLVLAKLINHSAGMSLGHVYVNLERDSMVLT